MSNPERRTGPPFEEKSKSREGESKAWFAFNSVWGNYQRADSREALLNPIPTHDHRTGKTIQAQLGTPFEANYDSTDEELEALNPDNRQRSKGE